jgi:hypothetical protein
MFLDCQRVKEPGTATMRWEKAAARIRQVPAAGGGDLRSGKRVATVPSAGAFQPA